MYFKTWGIKSIFFNICKWSVTFKNCIKFFFKCPDSESQGKPEEFSDWGQKGHNLLQQCMNVNVLVLMSTLGKNWVTGT